MSLRIVFQKELEDLHDHVRKMGERVEAGYNLLEGAWENADEEILKQLLDTDRQVREVQRDIEARCLMLMTKQQPVAGDLRQITAALKAVTDIERVGDHVGDIAELYLRLKYDENNSFVSVLNDMYLEVKEMFHKSIEAFVEKSAEDAKVADMHFHKLEDDVWC